uniref:Phosphatidylinositol N-acetylglucosaminyltransferase subunit Q n=1 Tax=Phlebotomus papatasi TaxID=29031 RepID=A0A1B0D3N8_PHLPP
MFLISQTVVYYLRGLLTSLRGSPAGLKLNVQLNHFLLKCFIYHVDLWATFLEIVSPAIHYLFLPLSILGLCGLSFQLALLSDLLVLITLHAHCFYIYAAVLYRLEIVGIGALWRVVLGRRKNILKNRVESFDYKNSQLYLATLFFASLLFLLPTVLVYYVVFATLRFGTYCITYILLIIRRRILHLPVDTIMRWLLGVYISPDNVEVKLMDVNRGQVNDFAGSISAIFIKPLPSWPSNTMTDVQNGDSVYSINQFFIRLIKGQLMGSIQPKYSTT